MIQAVGAAYTWRMADEWLDSSQMSERAFAEVVDRFQILLIVSIRLETVPDNYRRLLKAWRHSHRPSAKPCSLYQ